MADHSTHATLNYGDRAAPQEFPDRHEKVSVRMLDGRCHGKECDAHGLRAQLDTAGFCLATDAPVIDSGVVKAGLDLQDPRVVETRYMSFLQAYLQKTLGCHEVIPVNFVHRTSGTESAIPTGGTQNVPARGDTTGAIANVHADYTEDSLLVTLLRQRLNDDEETNGGRFTLVNCWRPLAMVHRWPLGVCDAASVVDEEELYPRQTPENNNAVSNSFAERAMEGHHQWFFFPDMSPEEMIVFKQWDEDTSMRRLNSTLADWKLRGVARQTLHSSFNLEAPPEAPARQSLEARFACIWKPQPSSRL